VGIGEVMAGAEADPVAGGWNGGEDDAEAWIGSSMGRELSLSVEGLKVSSEVSRLCPFAPFCRCPFAPLWEG
jgi:hypothetical protein